MIDWQKLNEWKVLVVDDESDNREVVAETLEFFGLTVKTAQNGLEGLKLLDEFSPTLVLLDLSMPEMDGWQMRARLKADVRTQDVPVVALTAHAMAGDKERALEVGFDGYMTKPINVPTMMDDLRAALKDSLNHDAQKNGRLETVEKPVTGIPSNHVTETISGNNTVEMLITEKPVDIKVASVEDKLVKTKPADKLTESNPKDKSIDGKEAAKV